LDFRLIFIIKHNEIYGVSNKNLIFYENGYTIFYVCS